MAEIILCRYFLVQPNQSLAEVVQAVTKEKGAPVSGPIVHGQGNDLLTAYAWVWNTGFGGPAWKDYVNLVTPGTNPSASGSSCHALVAIGFDGHVFIQTFGGGHAAATKLDIARNFGRTCLCNGISKTEIRSFVAQTFGYSAKVRSEKRSGAGPFFVLEIPEQANRVRGFSAKTKQGSDIVIEGSTGLQFPVPLTVNALRSTLKKLWLWWNAGTVKDKTLAALDRMEQVTSQQTITRLDDLLWEAVEKAPIGSFGFAVDSEPYVDASRFELKIGADKTKKKADVGSLDAELVINTFRANGGLASDVRLSRLRPVFADGQIASDIDLSKCFVWDTRLTGTDAGDYMIDEGVWWRINSSFVKDLETDFKSFVAASKNLLGGASLDAFKKSKHHTEDGYLTFLEKNSSGKFKVLHLSKFVEDGVDLELADIVLNGKVFIHAKPGSNFGKVEYVAGQARQAAKFLVDHDAFQAWALALTAKEFGKAIDLGSRSQTCFAVGIISPSKNLKAGLLSPRCMQSVLAFKKNVERYGFTPAVFLIPEQT